MKIEKTKHDHSLTKLLKVCIFAMLMIAPLFASCSQLLYVTFNKNAYQSTQITGVEYYTTYEYETNEVNSVDDLIVGNIYQLNIPSALGQETYNLYASAVYNLSSSNATDSNIAYAKFSVSTTDLAYLRFVKYGSTQTYSLQKYNVNGVGNITYFQSENNYTYNLHLEFVYYDYGEFSFPISYISASDYLGKTTVNERPIQALDNAFYYGVEKMTESPLFNWTQNTALYTGIKAMTDNLQVQTNVIAVLVTYWTILTIIYIIIDIVLALFTKMTHLLVRSD